MMRLSDSDLKISVLPLSHRTAESGENDPFFHSRPTSGKPESQVIEGEFKNPVTAEKDTGHGTKPQQEELPTAPAALPEGKISPSLESLSIPPAFPPANIATSANGASLPLVPSEEDERGFVPVLRNRNFLALWSGQIFSQLADKVYLVLMIALIDTRFQSADQTISGWVSAVMIAFTIPAVLFGAAAGVFVDRWPKKTVLVATNLLRGSLVLTLPLLLWLSQGLNFGSVPVGFCLLLLVTFLVSMLTQFFAPAEQSALPLIVERRNLLSANSLYTTTMMGSVIIGFAVGEPLLALADAIVGKLGGGMGIGKELAVGGVTRSRDYYYSYSKLAKTLTLWDTNPHTRSKTCATDSATSNTSLLSAMP